MKPELDKKNQEAKGAVSQTSKQAQKAKHWGLSQTRKNDR